MTFSICLTHDVDRTQKTYQYVYGILHNLLKGNLQRSWYHFTSFFGKDPYWNFQRIISLEKKYNVKSTFFFLHETMPFNLLKPATWVLSLGRYKVTNRKVKNVIQWLDRNGWEIGVHGSYNSYKNGKLLRKEKKLLERIVGHSIPGVRLHYHRNLKKRTWDLQKQAGFEYDASFGFTDRIGFKGKIYTPFRTNEKFLVLPLVIQDKYLVRNKNWKTELGKLMDETKKNNAVLNVLWHQRVFNEQEFPKYREVYEYIIQEGKRRKVKFLTCKEVFDKYN
jgi:peptidoglycan/xylan/chitin deacetylase (PgdA/CDA1 family)